MSKFLFYLMFDGIGVDRSSSARIFNDLGCSQSIPVSADFIPVYAVQIPLLDCTGIKPQPLDLAATFHGDSIGDSGKIEKFPVYREKTGIDPTGYEPAGFSDPSRASRLTGWPGVYPRPAALSKQPRRGVNMPNKTYEFTTEDVEYLRHGDTRLIARLYKPKGAGPFPAVIDLHGGAWNSGDLTGTQGLDQTLARNGFVVASLNFRHAADGYPNTLIDINYAIRWLKSRARDLNIRPDQIGIAGQSSGGHLAMLAAMRPNDRRYVSVPLPAGSPAVDATVRAVAMSWPVINPLSRYRHAQKLEKAPNPPAFSVGMKEKHDTYWKTEAAMAEGNPMLLLERGEKVPMPPALWVQGRPDIVHDYHDDDSDFPGNEPERFVSNYRKAGGDIEIVYVDNEKRSTSASFDPIAAFFHKHLG